MSEYRKLLSSFPGVTTLKIRYQTLEIINGEPCIFAENLFHNLTPDEYNLSLEQVINNLQSTSRSYWISPVQIKDQILSCVATRNYRNIREFKALEVQQTAKAASETAVVVTKNDLERISRVEDVIKVASEICYESFHYHIVEDAILNANGWECLRRNDNRVIAIEDDEWLVTHKNRLFQEFPWIAAFDPPKYLLEYGLKLVTLGPGEKQTAEVRQRMLTKALRKRTNEAIHRNSDLGHAFCIAILLIGIYQCNNESQNN
jgi:hypothetical protein